MATTLKELYQIPSLGEDVFCARFSAGRFNAEGAEQQLLALGHADGSVTLHGAATGKLFHTIPGYDWAAAAPPAAPASPSGRASPAKPPPLPSTGGLPVTALRWRPEAAPSAFKLSESTTARNVLLVASSDGTLRHVHAGSGRVLTTIVEEGTQIYAVDYRGDARFFASAGNAKCVRVYDEETRALTVTLAGGQLPGYGYASVAQAAGEAPPANAGTGHSSRIFSVAWHPVEGEGNILASGGWDNTVQVWDMRCVFVCFAYSSVRAPLTLHHHPPPTRTRPARAAWAPRCAPFTGPTWAATACALRATGGTSSPRRGGAPTSCRFGTGRRGDAR
jgi:WD40 repeat protein